jgi:penicillin-insensitive murein endopeptidase
MRPSRNRYYGHPDLIAFVQNLGKQAKTLGGRLLIGDLSQLRGGPMSYGHRSHQIGLDADIWFYQGPEGRDLTRKEAEKLPMLSMIRAAEASMNTARWSPLHRDLLKLAARHPSVERIFVNPIIKQNLCRTEPDRAWLRKIRAWWGHDAHFHVRLGCPAGNPRCRPQKPVPPGDGCGKDLDRWVWELQEAAKSPSKPKKKSARKPPSLPAVCQKLVVGN